MIVVENLRVAPIKVNLLLVTWGYGQTLEDFHNYTFVLQRSISSDSGFEDIKIITDEVSHADEVNTLRLWKDTYYRIRSTNNVSGEEWISDPESVGYPPNLEALEIVRRMDILLTNPRHGIGTPCASFVRKRDGSICECWDIDKRKLRKSNCDDCFGTHFENGFYPPSLIWINFSPDNKTAPIPEWGETEPNDSRALTSNHPLLNPRDVVLDPAHMNLFIVNGVEVSARRGYTLHQVLDLGYQDRCSVLYKLVDKYATELNEIKESIKGIKYRG